MSTKTILITGATDGIGKTTAKALAKQGHHLIIHGRNKEKAISVCQEIKDETGNQNVDYILADLLHLAEVKRMAAAFKSKYHQLDILINNAGAVFGKERSVTTEGLESTMAINVFAPLLLTELLLDLLAKSPEARIVNVASGAHAMVGKPDLEDMQFEKKYSFMDAYGKAKLYFIWLNQYLAKDLKKRGYEHITANSLHRV
ncbi:MAG: SDR family NAD(P)-dependent oxidoreductase [Bacteroidia bacterium]